MGSLKSKFLYQLSASVLLAFIPVITFPYITRVLGPDRLGAINFVDYTAQIFITLANFGIPLYAVREVSKLRDTPAHLQKLVSELLSIHLLTTLIGLIAFLISMRLSCFDETENYLIVLASLNIFFSAFSLNWFAHGLEDFKTLTLRSLIIKAIVTVLVFLLIEEAKDYNKYYFILVGGSIALISYDVYYLKRKGFSLAFTKHIKKHIHPLTIFFLTSASISIYTLFDTFILGILTTTYAVGFYTTALKIIRLFQGFVNSLGGVLLPRIAYLIERKEEVELSKILQKSLLYVFTIAVPSGFLFFLLAPEIVIVIAGNQYLEAVSTLQILSLLPLLIGLSNIFGIQVLIPYSKEKQLLKAVISGSIISIVSCIVLCPLFEENGAAFATVITELAVTLIMGFYANRLAPVNMPIKSLFTIGITAVSFIPIVMAMRYAFADNVLVLAISLTACMILFGIIQLYVFSNPVLLEIMQFARTFLLNFKNSK